MVIPQAVAIWQMASAYCLQKSAVVAGPPDPPPLHPSASNGSSNPYRAVRDNFADWAGFIAWPPRSRLREAQFGLASSGGSSAHAHVQRLPMIEDRQAPVALGAGQARVARQLLQPGQRRVQPLVAERKGTVAGGDEEARLEVVEGVERVERREVLLAEGGRLVAGDGQERDVGVKPAADLRKAREVTGVARHIGAGRGVAGERADQVAAGAAAEV